MGYGYMWLTIPSPSYFAARYHGQCAYVFPSNEFCTARLEMADTARWLLRGIKKQSPSDSNGPLCSKFQSYRFSSEYRNTACPAGYVTSCAANAERATGQRPWVMVSESSSAPAWAAGAQHRVQGC